MVSRYYTALSFSCACNKGAKKQGGTIRPVNQSTNRSLLYSFIITSFHKFVNRPQLRSEYTNSHHDIISKESKRGD